MSLFNPWVLWNHLNTVPTSHIIEFCGFVAYPLLESTISCMSSCLPTGVLLIWRCMVDIIKAWVVLCCWPFLWKCVRKTVMLAAGDWVGLLLQSAQQIPHLSCWKCRMFLFMLPSFVGSSTVWAEPRCHCLLSWQSQTLSVIWGSGIVPAKCGCQHWLSLSFLSLAMHLAVWQNWGIYSPFLSTLSEAHLFLLLAGVLDCKFFCLHL